MNKRNLTAGLLGAVAGAAGYILVKKYRARTEKDMLTASYVDLARFVGDWYDVAHYPNRWQKDSVGSRVSFSLEKDDELKMEKTWFKGGFDGEQKTYSAKVVVSDPITNAKLKVQYFMVFWYNYWILDVADQYQWAILGEPSRCYLTILSRTPELLQSDREQILERVRYHGYDPEQLHWEQHRADEYVDKE